MKDNKERDDLYSFNQVLSETILDPIGSTTFIVNHTSEWFLTEAAQPDKTIKNPTESYVHELYYSV